MVEGGVTGGDRFQGGSKEMEGTPPQAWSLVANTGRSPLHADDFGLTEAAGGTNSDLTSGNEAEQQEQPPSKVVDSISIDWLRRDGLQHVAEPVLALLDSREPQVPARERPLVLLLSPLGGLV